MLEVMEGNRDQVGDTQNHYISSGSVDTSTREIEGPGNSWRREDGPCWILTLIVSRLVGKLGCVKSPVLVKNSGQLLCKELSSTGWLTPKVI